MWLLITDCFLDRRTTPRSILILNFGVVRSRSMLCELNPDPCAAGGLAGVYARERGGLGRGDGIGRRRRQCTSRARALRNAVLVNIQCSAR